MAGISLWKRYLPILIGGLLVLLVVSGLVVFVKSMLDAAPSDKKMVQQITLIQPPPPPKIEKPPEPEVREEVKVEEPEPEPEPEMAQEELPEMPANDLPVGADLGLDMEGVAGGDAFGLVARKGGRDLLAARGSEGRAYTWYASAIQSDIQEYLSEISSMRKQHYSVRMHLWIERDGRIKRFELLDTTGDAGMDTLLRTSLANLDRIRERPPDDLPQPVRIRITSRL